MEAFKAESNCSELCYPIFFNFLNIPMCESTSSYLCAIKYLFKKARKRIWEKCFQNKFSTIYDIQSESYVASKTTFKNPYIASIKLNIDYISPNVDVSTEQYIISTSDFIGSVGGSLGLFLGFSIFTCPFDVISKMSKCFK